MAEMNTQSAPGKQRGGRRTKKLSTRVDMTPMVDLGFLLITFFMLTTTLLKPSSMDLIMPKDGDPQKIQESKALTILLGAHDKVLYYEGMGTDVAHPPVVKNASFASQKGIRDVIATKRKQVIDRFGKNDLMVLIKADEMANYKNVVDIMDEMLINRVDRYAVVDITPAEKAFLK